MKAATLIFIYWRGSSQKGKKSVSIYLVELISYLSCTNMHAFMEIYLPKERQGNKDRLLVSFEATLTNNVDQDHAAPVGAL